MGRKVFVMYDARAADGDTDDATVYVTADSEREARSYNDSFPDGVWFEYDLATNPDGAHEATSHRMRPDLRNQEDDRG